MKIKSKTEKKKDYQHFNTFPTNIRTKKNWKKIKILKMEASVLKTLQKIRKETPRKFKDLRSICDDLIGKEKQQNK